MITISKKEEMEKYLVGGTYVIGDDVTINISLDLECWDLKCGDLKCGDLKCRDLKCWDLKCGDLKCYDLNYYAFAIAYNSFKCKSAKARRENGFHKCLDSEIEYIKDEPKETIKIGNVVFDKSEVEERLQGLEPLKGVE